MNQVLSRSETSRSEFGLRPYGVALLGVAAATLLKLLIQPLARQDEASLGFFAAVMFAAWYGGLVPGLVATFVSALVSDYLFLAPLHAFSFGDRADWMRLGQFLVEGSLISAMGGSLHRARVRATAQKERAEAANRAKDSFLATVSHELRTPLNSILGWTQLLRGNETAIDQEELAEGLSAIERNARAQSRLIEDLLDVARITAGKMRLAMRPLDARQIVEAAMQTVRPVAEAKGVRLLMELDEVGLVMGDQDRLQQVVWNLASNAIKFTPAGGSVRIGLTQHNGRVTVTVSDSGIGISREFLPHLFTRFEQAGTGSSHRHGGLGLGLAIVRHLVELHGGTVWAHSAGENRGACFTVELPSHSQPPPVIEPAPRAAVSLSVPS
jgi:signal transduction histidine kinase